MIEQARIEAGLAEVKIERARYQPEDNGLPAFRLSDIPDERWLAKPSGLLVSEMLIS